MPRRMAHVVDVLNQPPNSQKVVLRGYHSPATLGQSMGTTMLLLGYRLSSAF